MVLQGSDVPAASVIVAVIPAGGSARSPAATSSMGSMVPSRSKSAKKLPLIGADPGAPPASRGSWATASDDSNTVTANMRRSR